MSGFFVTGIGTDIGKTVVSAVLVESLKAHYWKPVQSGGLDFSDSDFIKEYTNQGLNVHHEAYVLQQPMAPFFAANLEYKKIEIQHIKLPKYNNTIIVEGAGGLMVPLTDHLLVSDLIKHLNLPVILVSKNYLGSINHALLSVEYLKQKNIPIVGIIFNGDANPDSEVFILKYTGLKLLGRIPKADIISKGFIIKQAEEIRKNILPLLSSDSDLNSSTDLPIDYESF